MIKSITAMLGKETLVFLIGCVLFFVGVYALEGAFITIVALPGLALMIIALVLLGNKPATQKEYTIVAKE